MVTKTLRDLFEVNVIANVHLFNSFMPLILKGQAKKVITISSGLADTILTSNYDLALGSLYSTSKAAMNMIVAKYSAQYKKDGVLFLALSPGLVEVGHYKDGKMQCSMFLGVFDRPADQFLSSNSDRGTDGGTRSPDDQVRRVCTSLQGAYYARAVCHCHEVSDRKR